MAKLTYNPKYICTTLKEEVRLKEAANPPGKRIMDHIIWMDNEVIPGAFYSEVVWFWPGVIRTPEEQRKKPGLAEHTHPFDEVLAYLGTDPKDPSDLGGEIEFWLGGKQFNLTKSFMVYIPAGMKHCPLKHITINRPIFHFTMGPGTMYTWEGAKEKSPELEDKSKYFIFGDKPNLKLPEFRHPIPPGGSKHVFEKVYQGLNDALKKFKGVLVENKRLSISVHYRLAEEDKPEEIEKAIKQVISDIKAEEQMLITTGKKVYELRPAVTWDKGNTIDLLIEKYGKGGKENGLLPMYLGDDLTDEDGFRAIEGYKAGLSVFVGEQNRQSKAHYFLESPSEVETFLERLLE